MTDQTYKSTIMEADLKATFHLLRNAFPKLDEVPLRESILTSPLLVALAKRLELNIPIGAYPSELITLHQQLTEDYYQHYLKLTNNYQSENRQLHVSSQSISNDQENQLDGVVRIDTSNLSRAKIRVNYNDLANFVLNFNAEQENRVSQQLIQMGRAFQSWSTKEVDSVLSPRPQLQKRESRQQPAEIKFGRQKSQKTEPVNILLGKNISLASREMRQQIIRRAQNNKFLEENTNLSLLEKTGIEINYILNRITQEYFDDFRQELKPYVKNQYYSFVICEQILVKVLEQHNFINIYCRLIKSIKNEVIELEAQKFVEFKYIFVEKLQQSFYGLIRNGSWQGRQQLYKKQLIGMSLFVGELFHMHILSKNIFPDIFYEVVHNYVLQYHLYSSDKTVYYYQVYIECIIKIIQKMGKYYEQLAKNANFNNIQEALEDILNVNNPSDFNFKHICNYIELLKLINNKLPSQRFKITFLLQDFKCSKALKKQQQNTQFQFVKKLLSIDINQQSEINRLPQMVARIDPQKMMKFFFIQFAEGNLKKVNKNIEIFKNIALLPQISDAAINAFKNSIEDLYLMQSDFPFLLEGVAKMLRIVCDIKKIEFSELKLGEQDHPDQDIRDFLQNIEGKFYKLIMED